MTIVMPPGQVSCIGGTKYPHCNVLYCIYGLYKAVYGLSIAAKIDDLK